MKPADEILGVVPHGPEARSHRDPLGHVVITEDRVLRIVAEAWRPVYERLKANKLASAMVEDGRLINTWEIAAADAPEVLQPGAHSGHFLLEHDRIAFPSFPYEWPAEMLHAAARLTLDLAAGFLDDGLQLKDATPFNILFRGSQPVFIDVLSFEMRLLGDPLWRPEGQFVQTALLPLLLARRFGMAPHRAFLADREGVSPSEFYRLLSPVSRCLPSYLWLVTLPTLLSGRARNTGIYRARQDGHPEKVTFLLKAVMSRLRRQLTRTAPADITDSVWSNYERTHSYSEDAFAAKRQFVGKALERIAPRRALDIGCNEGAFTLMAAEAGASVVAIDYDPVVVGRVWRRAAERGLDVLPLVQNLSAPSPAMGWCYGEFPSFLDRARGGFDVVMMLAVIHHFLITDRVPIDELFDLIAKITTDYLLIEYVGPSDEMFKTILRGRDRLFDWFGPKSFEAAARRRFTIVDSEALPNRDRNLYLMRLTKSYQ